MSLQTDKAFFDAIKADRDTMHAIGGRLYSTAIPMPDEDALNAPVPYAIVTFDGLTNDDATKDDPYEGETDSVQVSIELAAPTRPDLAALAELTRRAVRSHFRRHEAGELIPSGYRFSASRVAYDPDKPCFFQTLTYQCDTQPD